MAERRETAPHGSRARRPDTQGVAERDGVTLSYATYGTGEPTVVLMPTWSIVPSRFWRLRFPTSHDTSGW